MGFVPKTVYPESVNYVCVNCEDSYSELEFGYCDNELDCVWSDVYEVKTGIYYPAD